MQHIIVTDIDGTLIRTGRPIHARAIQAADAFIQQKGKLVLCTGRAACATEAIARQLRIATPCIVCGGSMLYDFQARKTLWSNPLPPAYREAVNWILQNMPTCSVTVYTAEKIYTIRTNERLLARGVKEDREAPLCGLADIREDIYKILIVDEDASALRALPQRLPFLLQCEYHASSRHFYEITAQGTNKGAAIRMLLRYLGEEAQAVYAAGDSMSDLTMRPHAKLFFAPDDAPDAVRASADQLFGLPEDGGWAQVVEHVLREMKQS